MKKILEIIAGIIAFIPGILVLWKGKRQKTQFKKDLKERDLEIKRVEEKTDEIKKTVKSKKIDDINKEFGWEE